MPLPLIPVLIGVGAAALAIGVIVSVVAFVQYIKKRKAELQATEAKITKLLREGKYATINVGLTEEKRKFFGLIKKKHLLEEVEYKVKDPNHELHEGMTI